MGAPVHINRESSVSFVPLVVRREENAPAIIGDPSTGRFIEADDDAALALHLLRAHDDIGSAEAAWPRSRGETPDLVGLCEEFHRRGFLTRVDAVETGSAAASARYRAPPALGEWLRRPWLTASVIALAALGFALFVTTPGFDPIRMGDWRIARDNTTAILAVSLGFGLVTLLHELGHYFAARSYGIPARIRVGHRYGIPVLITDVTSAWILPRAARIRIFLAGIAVNATIASVALIAIALSPFMDGPPVQALRFIAALNLPPIVFQFLIFAKTDLYYVLAALVGERNLSRDANQYVLSRLKAVMGRAIGRSAPLPTPAEGPRKNILLAFGVLSVTGIGLCVVAFPLVFLMIVIALGQMALALPRTLQDGGPASLILPVIAIAFGGFQMSLLVGLPLRDALTKWAQRARERGGII